MNNPTPQAQIKQQLVLLTDAYIVLSDNPTWAETIAQHPELEALRLAAVDAADNIWFKFRCATTNPDD